MISARHRNKVPLWSAGAWAIVPGAIGRSFMSIPPTISKRVQEAIEKELEHQQQKWGKDKQQSLAGYLLILQYEINEAVDGWMKNKGERNSSLQEIVQVVATGVACLDFYGVEGNALSTNDITEAELRRERLERSNRRFGVEP
jgi:NTP pyrophosphatase (non-canonical NTP hydrolase)